MFKRAAQRINVDPKPRVYRADEIEHSGRITEQIIDAIRTADVVVADVTGLNPNVMWELGYAFALDKEIIITIQEIDESPFDLREWRQVTYSTDFTRDETNSLTRFFAASLGLPESDELSAVDELAELVGDGCYLVTMWEYQPNADSELKVAGWLDGSAVTVHELLGPTAEQVMLVFENQWVRRTPPTSLERDPSVGFQPTQIRGNESPVGGIVDGGESRSGPALEGGEVAVAGRQDSVADKQLAQVFSAVGETEPVDAVVAEWNLAGGDGVDAFDHMPILEPGQSTTWDLHRCQCIDKGNQRRRDYSGSVIEEPIESGPERASTATDKGVEVIVGATGAAHQILLDPGMLRRTKCASVRRALRRNPGRSPDARAILGGTGAA